MTRSVTAPRPFVPFRTPVRGFRFAARPPGADVPGRETTARLVREPDHPLDPLAVAVWVGGDDGPPWRIGYLERAVAARLAPRLDAGQRLRARLDGWVTEPGGRWRRPLLAVEAADVALRPAPLQPQPARATRRIVDQSRKTA